MNVICEANFEKSPVHEFLLEFNVALAGGNFDKVSKCITDDVIWHLAGEGIIEGKNEFLEVVKEMQENRVMEIYIEKIVCHDQEGALNGVIKYGNQRNFAFADIYSVTKGKYIKINEMTSYLIPF